VRLILINQPYIDHWSWRQSDVAAIARNFLDQGFCFGYPQIDWAGGSAGYVGTEFPILPFLAAICYKFAGIHEWIGRSQSVIFFAISLPFFFLLVREIFGSTAGAWATFFYAFAPLNVLAGRSFMPDVPSLSLGIIGLYLFLRWVHHPKPASFYLSAVAISLSILIKATSVVIGRADFVSDVAGGAELGPVQRGQVWGSRSQRQRLQLAGFCRHCDPTLGRIGIGTRIKSPRDIILIISLAPVVFGWKVFRGTGMLRNRRRHRVSHPFWGLWRSSVCSSRRVENMAAFLIGGWLPMLLFVVGVGYGNRHPWYQLPFVPIAAAFAGAACAFIGSKISSRVAAVTLSILLAGSFAILAGIYVRPLYESSAAQLRDAGLELNKITAPDALIVAADMGNPTIFYYAKRRGWHFLEQRGIYGGTPKDSQQAIADLERLHRQGATHFVFTTNTFWWRNSYPEFTQHLAERATLVEATPEFMIHKLTAPP
jgi:hypothetical protein